MREFIITAAKFGALLLLCAIGCAPLWGEVRHRHALQLHRSRWIGLFVAGAWGSPPGFRCSRCCGWFHERAGHHQSGLEYHRIVVLVVLVRCYFICREFLAGSGFLVSGPTERADL